MVNVSVKSTKRFVTLKISTTGGKSCRAAQHNINMNIFAYTRVVINRVVPVKSILLFWSAKSVLLWTALYFMWSLYENNKFYILSECTNVHFKKKNTVWWRNEPNMFRWIIPDRESMLVRRRASCEIYSILFESCL